MQLTGSPPLKISQCVLNRLENVKEPCTGHLYGLFFKSTLIVVGAHIQDFDNTEMVLSFPTSVDQCGAFKISTERINEHEASKMIQDIVVTDNPLYLHKIINKTEIEAYNVINDRMEYVNYDVISEKEIYEDIVHLRLQTKVPLICELNQEAIIEGIKQLTNEMAMGLVAFNIANTNVFLLGSSNEQASGAQANSKIGEVCKKLSGEREKKTERSYNIDVLVVNMFKKATIDPYSDTIKKHAPIVHVDKRMDQMLLMALEIDCLSMVYKHTKISRLYDILIESAYRNLKLVQNLLLKNFEDVGGDQKLLVSQPEIYHFLPDGLGHFITRVYDANRSDSSLLEDRKILHKQFMLPMTQPIFRRSNRYIFKGEQAIPGKLINPHEEVKNTSNGGEIALVKGKYAYFHYKQDIMDDDGWGCAYRSLQTLASWFYLQGHTDKKVPTYKDIQKCLVDIGDKPANFVNSSQWIGSTEVNFVLSSLLDVECKILYCSSGAEVGSHGPDLVYHFKHHGSPIMIGGGVLAHTILGVDYNQQTGDIKFLILDPHYTGDEDLQTIVKKGWCGWKGVDFWDKKSYYNMCLPQVPRVI